MHALFAYGWVTYGGVEIVATVQEGSKHAAEQDVTLYDDGILRAGRVTRFLVHVVPGCIPDLDHVCTLVWTSPRHEAAEARSKAIGCPIFKSTLEDDPQGSWWPI